VKFPFVLGLAVLLTACTHLPGPAVKDWPDSSAMSQMDYFSLDGRLSVRAEERAFSGGLSWLRQPDDERIVLSTPLGQAVAEIRREAGGLRLTDPDGHSQLAASGEALLERALGVGLPADSLRYWVSARPHPAASFEAEFDLDGRPLRLIQDGWHIEYGRYREIAGRWLPGRLFARRSEVLELRLVVDIWALP